MSYANLTNWLKSAPLIRPGKSALAIAFTYVWRFVRLRRCTVDALDRTTAAISRCRSVGLTDDDLRRVPCGDGLTESQVEIISYRACSHITHGIFYVGAVGPGCP